VEALGDEGAFASRKEELRLGKELAVLRVEMSEQKTQATEAAAAAAAANRALQTQLAEAHALQAAESARADEAAAALNKMRAAHDELAVQLSGVVARHDTDGGRAAKAKETTSQVRAAVFFIYLFFLFLEAHSTTCRP
jgi:hypothetical protein